MKRLLYISILLFMLTALHTVKLSANSSTAGNTLTVNRESGFNALRSPALMSWQEDDSIGMGFIYSLQAYNKSEGTISAGGPEINIKVDTNDIFKGTLLFSYVVRLEDHSFGIGIRNTDDSQLVISESDTRIEGSSENDDEKKLIINVSSVLSYSYRFSNRQSIGVQAEAGYSRKKTDKEIRNWSTGDYNNTDEVMEAISGSCSIGYSFIGNSFEYGLLINSGEFSRQKTSLSYDALSGSYYSGSNSTGQQYLMNKGFGIITGIGFKPDYKLLIVLEGGAQFPNEYEKDSVQDKPTFIIVNNKIKSSGVYLIRGGLDYQINRSISAGVGAGYIYTSSETNTNNVINSDTVLNLIEFTSGVELRLSNRIKLIFACDLLYTIADLSMSIPAYKVDLGIDSLNVNFAAGISKSF